MATKPPSVLIAVDTNFLLDLADGDERCIDCLDELRSKGKKVTFLVLPTVLQELAYLNRNGKPAAQKLAKVALSSILLKWGFNLATTVPVDHGIVEIIGNELRAKEILPDKERNDSFVIAEAAVCNCALLITSDNHLHGIDRSELQSVLERSHVSVPVILKPAQAVKLLGKR